MTTIHKLNQDLEEIRAKIFILIQDEDSFTSKELFNRNLENAFEKEEKIKLKLKNYVINHYNGYEKFSNEVLEHVYQNTLLNIDEHSLNLEENIESHFKNNMYVIELAYADGRNGI